MMDDDARFMTEALREARAAFSQGEVPVGAVLVHDGRVIAKGYNQVETLCDATAHAEMLCMTAGASALGNWRLTDTTLYCTVEPCSMCAGALLLSRVSTLVWGTEDVRHGANGSWIDLFAKQHPTHTMTIRSGILREQCADLMRQFFRKRRQEREA